MTTTETGCTLGELLANEQLGLTLLTEGPGARSRPVSGARLALDQDLDDVPDDLVLVLVERPPAAERLLATLARVAETRGTRIIAFAQPDDLEAGRLAEIAGPHILLGLPATSDPAELISEIGRATALAEVALTRQLTSLQRALAQVLAAPAPLQALTARLAQICHAVVTLVTADGTSEFATGPVPLSLLLPEISRSEEEAQRFAASGWYGMAVRVSVPAHGGDAPTWLLVARRRDGFPDPYSTAAIFIAASLAETSLQIDLGALRQERAVRSAVLEQALALRAERHDAELAGRVASLGVSFDQEARAVVIEIARSSSAARDATTLEGLHETLQRTLDEDDISHLTVLRENRIVSLAQASAAALRRTVVKAAPTPRDFLLGIGRDAADLGHVVDSYHDAQLAIRVLRRDKATRPSMCYEDFDFATRLFSDVGMDKMSEWAHELLRPLEDKRTMLVTLSTYFEHCQNIMEAADALAVHHNSLRYRLSKIESALQVSLRDPSAVSSLFLALTTLSMVEAESGTPRGALAPGLRSQPAGDAKGAQAAGAVLSESQQGLSAGFGAAVGPER